jgi:hypothetical protein
VRVRVLKVMDSTYGTIEASSRPEPTLKIAEYSCSWKLFFYNCIMSSFTVSTFVTIFLLCYFMQTKILPVVSNVTTIIDKADAVFHLLYAYLCDKTHLISAEDCLKLKHVLLAH